MKNKIKCLVVLLKINLLLKLKYKNNFISGLKCSNVVGKNVIIVEVNIRIRNNFIIC